MTRRAAASIWIVGLAIALAAATADADGARRVVLADSDPELRRAVEASLRPWRIEVVVEPVAPGDAAAAQIIADDQAAQFVVWRDASELVVFDRGRLQSERRAARVGAFDPLAAEAAALSIKTMMRLPPPPTDDLQPEPGGFALRFEIGAGERFERGLDDNFALRFSPAATIRPWRSRGWRFGATGDFGASATVNQAGFKGTWSNWSALAYASWTVTRDAWELEPWAAGGLERSSLDGTEMSTARSEQATLAAARAGIAVRWRVGAWSIGARLAAETVLGAPTYTKLAAPAEVFEVPPFGVVGSLMVATDLVP